MNPIGTLMPTTQKMREAASLLDVDVIVLCYAGRSDEAVESCHALLNTARSLGDEPTLVSQLVRMAILAITRNAIERTLGWGEPTEGLAPKLVTEVADVLSRVAETAPILLVEQNLPVVRRIADTVVVLDAGQVVHRGPAEELMADPDLTRELLGVSMRREARQ